jgi:hypothetical protein
MPPGHKKPLSAAQQEAILRKVSAKKKREYAQAADQLGTSQSAFKSMASEQDGNLASEPASAPLPQASLQVEPQGQQQQQQNLKMEPVDTSSMSMPEKMDHLIRIMEDLPRDIAIALGVT